MHKVPVWKPVLLAAIMALAVWSLYPLDKRLKPGLDLVGGTTLVYEVEVEPGVANRQRVLEDTIEVLKRRVDPSGVRNLVWRVQGTNRIEIQMALPPAQTTRLREAYVNARDALLKGNISERRLDAALKADPEQRDAMLTEMAQGHVGMQVSLNELAAAHDAMIAAHEPYQATQQRLRDAEAALRAVPEGDGVADARAEAQAAVNELLGELIPLTRTFNAARAELNRVRQKVLATNVDPVRLESILAMYDPDPTKVRAREAYQDALKALRDRDPQRADEIDKVARAHEAYAAVKGPLDDPHDLIALLRGSGVLEFRIAAPSNLPDRNEYIEQLRTRGPRAGGDKPWRWFSIDNPERFASDKPGYELLVNNPAQFFENRRIVGDEYAGTYYVLLGNRRDNAIRQEDGGWALTQVYPTRDEMGFSAIGFALNAVGGQLMSALTASHLQQPMAILLDGRVLSAPNINARIADSGIITGGQGGFSQRELQYLLNTMGAGSTQAQLSDAPVSIKTTGPQLGQDNLNRGLRAAVLSLLVVSVFMLVYYLFLGLVADLALLINMIVLLSVMAMLQATFTLPGIAGIVLTIGMAVDANVLIFERIREELERKADVATAVRLGYEKALSTIIDANITTLITCLVLGYTASAEVKGFAVTLGIGICATLFATLFAGRIIVDLYVQLVRPRSFVMLPTAIEPLRRLLSPNIDWLRLRYGFFAISATLIIAGVTMLYVRGADLLDLEFRSGTQIGFDLKPGLTMTLPEVRQRLDAAAIESNLPSLGGDQARVVTVGATERTAASAFSVQVIGDAQTAQISEAIKQAFADVIAAQTPIDFARMTAQLRGDDPAPVYVVREAALGANINRVSDVDVSEFVGGVAIVLDDLRPAATVDDITQRIARMREMPGEFEGLGYRPFTVVGLDLAPPDQQPADAPAPMYRSAVVVSRDASTNYVDSPDTFAESGGLADTEWRLVHDALQRDTSLASVTSFSSQVSDTMKQQAIAAIGLSMLAIIAYIWFRFGSFRYGLAAIIALIHDTTVALGLVAICGYVYDQGWAQMLLIAPFKIDLAMVAALLTLIGYSLNDTIIVFDRIRENRGRLAVATPGIINDSINQTISRTVITSGTTLIALVLMYFVGGPGVHGFAFAMIVGICIGTYSSIAVAAPFLMMTGKIVQKSLDSSAAAPRPA
jgi:SecD/SecF fusion protein